MAACLLRSSLSQEEFDVDLIEDPNQPSIGVGEGSTPLLRGFFEQLNIPESVWMKACDATFKLGIKFEGWSDRHGRTSYRHPFFSLSDEFTKRAFKANVLRRLIGLNVETSPEQFFLSSRLSADNKSPWPKKNFPFSAGYGYHFDSVKLGLFLRNHAVGIGVKHHLGSVSGASIGEDGLIESIQTVDQKTFVSDFFVDCTGFKGMLLQESLGVKFNSFDSNLFNDSAVVVQVPKAMSNDTETISTAMKNGWRWKIPLNSRYGYGYVYSSKFSSDSQARDELAASLDQKLGDESFRFLKMKVGQVDQTWKANCLSVGLSQGFIEPLEATALHLTQYTLEQFLKYFKNGDFAEPDLIDFNENIQRSFESVRDYIVAHYKLNNRDDSEYWIKNRETTPMSESLREILASWHSNRQLIEVANDGGQFNEFSWLTILSGYSVFPKLNVGKSAESGTDSYLFEKIEEFNNKCSRNYIKLSKALEKILTVTT